MGTHIRREHAGDAPTIRAVHLAAFDSPFEADLVERLRGELHPWHSFVAETDGAVVAHVSFSPVTMTPTPKHPVALVGLGPMAVFPEHQGRGIGSALADGALAALGAEGVDAVFVLGHPEWYPRFGFRPAQRFGIALALDAPAEAFMALELVPGVLLNISGKVSYHKAFTT
ncbi:MAG: N-acetyltransferase [Gammaproteobacteria bacterium]